MTCRDVIDRVYEFNGDESLGLLTHLRIQFHLLHCPHCGREIEKLETVRDIMGTDFFPPAPALEETLMREILGDGPEESFPEAAGISFRGWVITGLIILISLSTSFLGVDFIKIANDQGSSFLIPLGITIGAVISAYGALFIGSHLKELSDRFNLH